MAKLAISPSTVPVNTIQSLDDVVVGQAPSLKVAFDKAAADGKTYINDTLIAELNGDNGSKKIGHDSPNIAADNVNEALEEVYAAIASTVLGEIPDNSIPNLKLASDIKVGSLATLTTTEKSSVVGAINEIDAYVNGVPEQVDTIETDLNILRTAKTTTGSNVALAVDTDGTFDMTRNGNTLSVIPNVANTGAMTIAVDGQTARAIQKANDAGTLVALEAGDIKQNVPVQLVLQTSGTPVFIYAPKVGAIKYGSLVINTPSTAFTMASVISVSGKGKFKSVLNTSLTTATRFYFFIDGVRYPSTNTYSLNEKHNMVIDFEFKTSFVFHTDSVPLVVAYELADVLFVRPTAATAAVSSAISVTGKGKLTSISSQTRTTSLSIDGTFAFGSATVGNTFDENSCLYLNKLFSTGFVLYGNVSTGFEVKYELY